MDVVRLDGYTDDEKVFIARRYLLPRQLERAGLSRRGARRRRRHDPRVIRGYTREAGVRSLERELGRLPARRRRGRLGAGAAGVLDAEHLSDWLGRAKVVDDVPERTSCPVSPPAWPSPATAATCCSSRRRRSRRRRGEPGLTLTGQLGDVMKESAQIALNYVRSHAAELGVDPETVQPPLPRPRAGGCRAEGRSVGRHHDDDGARQPADGTSR